MTNPSDPWAHRPESPEAATERMGSSDEPAEQPLHTSEYSEAYGQGADPTEALTTEALTRSYGAHPGAAAYGYTEPASYFDRPPGPNATRELPYEGPVAYETAAYSDAPYGTAPYGTTWGYENPYAAPGPGPQWAGGGAPPGGPTEPVGPTGLPVEPPRRRRTGLWIALTAAVFVLVVLGGIAAGTMLAGNDSSTPSAAGTASRSAPSRVPVVPPGGSGGPSSKPGGPQNGSPLPGLGDIDSLGATMGTVSTNDGSTLTIDSMLGAQTVVHTDDRTEVIAAGAGTVADLKAGDMVVVQGDKAPDQSIHAKIIIGTAMGPPR